MIPTPQSVSRDAGFGLWFLNDAQLFRAVPITQAMINTNGGGRTDSWQLWETIGVFRATPPPQKMLKRLHECVAKYILPGIETGCIQPTPRVCKRYGYNPHEGAAKKKRYVLLIPTTEWNDAHSRFRPVLPDEVAEFHVAVYQTAGTRITYGPFKMPSLK